MKTRGKVLREPGAEPGLLIIEGQQFRFFVDGVWKSDIPPKPGLTVDVERDQSMRMVGITVVPEAQLNKERAGAAVSKAKEKGGELLGPVVAKAGTANLIAVGVLIVGWFWLTALSIQIPMFGSLKFTFWQVLGLLNSSNLLDVMQRGGRPGARLYGILALIALVAPFIYLFWKDKRAVLGGLAPLLFMLIVWIMARHGITSAFGGDLGGGDAELAKQAQEEAMKGVSLGFGAYLSVLASIYFAAIAGIRFLQGRTAGAAIAAKSNRAVA